MKITNEILLEKLNNFIERNDVDHQAIKAALEKYAETSSVKEQELSARLRILEDWKLVFVAKYSVYSAIALFLGSLVSTLAFDLIKNWITK